MIKTGTIRLSGDPNGNIRRMLDGVTLRFQNLFGTRAELLKLVILDALRQYFSAAPLLFSGTNETTSYREVNRFGKNVILSDTKKVLRIINKIQPL